MNWALLALVLLISVCETAAQTFAFLAVKHRARVLLLAAALVYAGITALLYQAYKFRGIGFINVIWSGATIALLIISGQVFFQERIAPKEWLGIVLVVAGIGIMLAPPITGAGA
jgi:spermidine export protein MdtI